MAEIRHYERLYGQSGGERDDEYLYLEKLETRSRIYDWDIQPHVHPRMYQLFYVDKGCFRFFAMDQVKDLQGPCLIGVPAAVLHGFSYEPETSGRILSVSDQRMLSFLGESEELMNISSALQLFENPEEGRGGIRVREILEQLSFEMDEQGPERQLMIKCIIQQLFVWMYRLATPVLSQERVMDPVALVHFRKFQWMLRNTPEFPLINNIAGELGITPEHLNRICKNIRGKTTRQLIQEYWIQEARKYLTYTSYTIAEISFLLHFEYPNYFARFFRKYEGISPKEYREKHLKIWRKGHPRS